MGDENVTNSNLSKVFYEVDGLKTKKKGKTKMYTKMKVKLFSLIVCGVMLISSVGVSAGVETGSISLNQGWGYGELIVGEMFYNRATAKTYTDGGSTLSVVSTTVYAYSGSSSTTGYGYTSATANINPLTYAESVHAFEMGRTLNLSCYP